MLVAATTRWVPTARLAMALAKAGFAVEAICPSQHPISKTGSAGKIHAYHGLAPIQSFTKAIAAAQPDLIIPGDDLATQHLHELYRCRKRLGNDGDSSPAKRWRSGGSIGGEVHGEMAGDGKANHWAWSRDWEGWPDYQV